LGVVSTELRQVFRAYTKQLRQAPAKEGKGGTESIMRRKGFEQVELSEEARQLAASAQETEASTKEA